MTGRMPSTAAQRKRWRKTANDLVEKIGPEPTSESAGQEEDILPSQAKLQIRFLVRIIQYPIMDKLGSGIPASCPCGHDFKIEGRPQERVSSHLRSHWPYSHIGFGYFMCKQPNCIQYYKRSDHACKCSSKLGHKSGRKRNNYPMRIDTSEDEEGEESRGDDEGGEGGEGKAAQTDYESDEESYELHKQEREKNKEGPGRLGEEKQENVVKRVVEGMLRKRPVVRVKKFGIKRKRNLRSPQRRLSYKEMVDSSAEDTTSDDTSSEDTASEEETPEKSAREKEQLEEQRRVVWEKKVAKRRKNWHHSDDEWIPEGKKEKAIMKKDENLEEKTRSSNQGQGMNGKVAEPPAEETRRGRVGDAEKKVVRESEGKVRKARELVRKNKERSSDKAGKEQEGKRSLREKEGESKIATTTFDIELRRVALENMRRLKSGIAERKLRIQKRKNLEKTMQSGVEPLRLQDKNDDKAKAVDIGEKARPAQKEEALKKWALQSDSGSAPSTPGKETSNCQEEEEDTIWWNWEENDVIVMSGDEVLGVRYRGSTTVQVVETGAEGEKVAGNAIVEVFDYSAENEETASSTSKASNGAGIDSEEEESVLGGVGEEKRRNLERRMARGEAAQQGRNPEEEAAGGNRGKQQAATQKFEDEEESMAAPAKVKSLVDPGYDEEDTEEEEVSG